MKNIRIYYLQLCALIVDNGSVEAITIVVADMRPSQTEMSINVLEWNGAKPSQEPNRTKPNRIELNCNGQLKHKLELNKSSHNVSSPITITVAVNLWSTPSHYKSVAASFQLTSFRSCLFSVVPRIYFIVIIIVFLNFAFLSIKVFPLFPLNGSSSYLFILFYLFLFFFSASAPQCKQHIYIYIYIYMYEMGDASAVCT